MSLSLGLGRRSVPSIIKICAPCTANYPRRQQGTSVTFLASKRVYHKNAIFNEPSNNDKFPLPPPSSPKENLMSSQKRGKTTVLIKGRNIMNSSNPPTNNDYKSTMRSHQEIINSALQKPAGPLYNNDSIEGPSREHSDNSTTVIKPGHSDFFIPEVSLHAQDGRKRNRVLV